MDYLPILGWLAFALTSVVVVFYLIAIFFKSWDLVVSFGMIGCIALCAMAGVPPCVMLTHFFHGDWVAAALWLAASVVASIVLKKCGDPSGVASDAIDVAGKTCLVTGGTGGMGKYIAAGLAEAGAKVIVASVDREAVVNDALAYINKAAKASGKGGSVAYERLDLSSVKAVREFAASFTKTHKALNLLVCNAGVLNLPGRSKDGIDLVVAINYIGHFVLTKELLPLLEESGKRKEAARIVNVASDSYKISDSIAHNFVQLAEQDASLSMSYPRSKLAVILATAEWQRKNAEAKNGVTAYAVHPGSMATGLYATFLPSIAMPLFNVILAYVLRTPQVGALVPLHCALSRSAEQGAGGYFANCQPVSVSSLARDKDAAKKLFATTEALVASK